MRDLLPRIVLRDLILPALSSFRGLSPEHLTIENEVLKPERSFSSSDKIVMALFALYREW